MDTLLSQIESPRDLQGLKPQELRQLAAEMRETLCNLVSSRTAHFASNLGVIELCLALHTAFDFSADRLIWDTGHQIYPHKMITGRYHEFGTMRVKGGLMGYPNPNESPYDLFMTGHAGSSVSTVLGLKSGDDLQGHTDRHAVAVIGDGAFPSGIVWEALTNTSGLKKKLIVVLNDNKMSICPRVGGLADYLDRLRLNSTYIGLKRGVQEVLEHVPLIGNSVERFLLNAKDSIKAGLHGGMLFEELGFRYIGPIDGHNIGLLQRYFEKVKNYDEPVLLHIVTEKGHGFQPAAADPVFFHTPAPFERDDVGEIISIRQSTSKPYTAIASDTILKQMEQDPRVTVMTAAMCQGNKLEAVREAFPDRFFDTGICEGHTVAFAAGQAKSGLRPVVDIYSTFLQRSFDQIFQEVALQNLPVTFLLDRAGLTGPDGPTHHGCFDLGYMRLFPNMVVMAPGDAADVVSMLDFSLAHDAPCSIRYPKDKAITVQREEDAPAAPVELGKAEVIRWGEDGMIIACGTLLNHAIEASAALQEQGFQVGVINARFIKPLDRTTLCKAIESSPFVLTVEEAALMGGFGSALLEAASEAGIDCRNVRRLGIPDEFVEFADRGELLADLGLDADGIAKAAREMLQQGDLAKSESRRQVG
jgi:1-deoxy-D-xylulose-5-phosphate synthase